MAQPYTNPPVSIARVDFTIVPNMRRVTFVFDTRASKHAVLHIPYAVSVGGEISHEAFGKKPKMVDATNVVEVWAPVGAEVKLYLNSDAHPDYRNEPVYAVTVRENHVEVKITEQMKPSDAPDTPTFVETLAERALDRYTAPLTGDIWMKISHVYSTKDVERLVTWKGIAPEVKEAVKKIYETLPKAELKIVRPAKDGALEATLTVTFVDASNPKKTITKYDQLKDGLVRAHPAGFAAIFDAALAAGATTVEFFSCWRPLIGSILHRAGLGHDVSILDGIVLNRASLMKDENSALVGADERKLFKVFRADLDAESDAEIEAKNKQKALAGAKGAADKARAEAAAAKKAHEAIAKKKPGEEPAAKGRQDAAEKKSAEADADRDEAEKASKKADDDLKKATEKRKKSEKAWDEERNAKEPAVVGKFRARLVDNEAVDQIFDPWRMDERARVAGSRGNPMHEDTNEDLHANHLHVTVEEPKIL